MARLSQLKMILRILLKSCEKDNNSNNNSINKNDESNNNNNKANVVEKRD